jgi:hypothetical protein
MGSKGAIRPPGEDPGNGTAEGAVLISASSEPGGRRNRYQRARGRGLVEEALNAKPL